MSKSLCTWAWNLAADRLERKLEVLLHRLRQVNDAVWPGLHCLCSLNDMPLPSKGEKKKKRERINVGGAVAERKIETR